MYSIASFDKFSQRRPLVHTEGYSSKTTFLEHMVDKWRIKGGTMKVERTMAKKPHIATYT